MIEQLFMSELTRKDLFVCLGIWLALEIVCFAILPALHLGQPRSSLQSWFLISLLLGIGGSCLMASSTQLSEFFQFHDSWGGNKIVRSLLVAAVSWLGLIGIGFPLLVISLQLFGKVFELLKS
jgi:hypothetical protein